MPTFEIEANGKTFEVEAPNLQTAAASFKKFTASKPSPAETPAYDVMGNATGAPTDGATGDGSIDNGALANVGRGLDSGARQFAKGVPVLGGAMDKVAAAGDAATYPVLGRGSEGQTFSDRYAKNLKSEKATDAAFEAANPKTATALNLAGGIASTLPLAATRAGAHALGMVGTLPARIVQGALGGGAIGSADAATRGDSVVNGGVLGGMLGGFSPVLGRGAGVIADRFMREATPEAIAGFSPRAIDKVARALGDDAASTSSLQRFGPEGMLIDAGPNLRMQGEALATQPGSASRIVGDAVTGRHERAGARIASGVDDTLGPYQNFRKTQDAAIATRRANGNTAYRQAFESADPVDVTAALRSIDDVVPAKLGRNGAPDPNSIEGALSKVRDRLAGDAGRRVDAREMHTIKMDLDDSIESAIRGGKNNQARVLSDVRNHVVDGLDSATGGANGHYAQARRQFRSDSSIINALDDGRTLFNKSTRPDDLVALVREMSETERQAFRIGARDAVDEVIGTVKNDALAARNLFGKEWNERKLAAVVGQDQADRLLAIIGRENAFANTYGAVQRGSQTRGRQAAGKEFPSSVEVNDLPSAGGRTWLGAGEQALRYVVNQARNANAATRFDREAADAARMLTAQGSLRDQIVQALTDHTASIKRAGPVSKAMDDIVTLLSQTTGREPARLVNQPRR